LKAFLTINKLSILATCFSLLVCSCKKSNPNWANDVETQFDLGQMMTSLTDVIVHDIFSPPQASRVYAYSSLAAYECLHVSDTKFSSFNGRLNGMPNIPLPDSEENVSYEIASSFAFCEVAKALVFSERKIEALKNHQDSIWAEIGVPTNILNNSKTFGNTVAKHILAWADKDNYKESRSYPRFAVQSNDQERWKPTPPAYMEAIEPHWNTIRPFALDSSAQFKPAPPPTFSLKENSPFYKELLEVYDVVIKANKEERAIASFWDCNPYVMNISGHVMHATKKITPGGHWMEICTIVNGKVNNDPLQSAHTYAMVSIGLADAFISCWDEKYRSTLVRPETLIHEHLDDQWQPILQTPPFPEYTSGHSVISTAAAHILTQLYGDSFSFVDDSELKYGLPKRTFPSFKAAAAEAAISRLYGGIHYRSAIDNGVEQGSKVGAYVYSKTTGVNL